MAPQLLAQIRAEFREVAKEFKHPTEVVSDEFLFLNQSFHKLFSFYKIYNGKNLLSISASSSAKYANAILEELFTLEELATGLIIDGPSLSRRQPLDREKLEIFKGNNFNENY